MEIKDEVITNVRTWVVLTEEENATLQNTLCLMEEIYRQSRPCTDEGEIASDIADQINELYKYVKVEKATGVAMSDYDRGYEKGYQDGLDDHPIRSNY